MCSLDEDVVAETKRQIADINGYRRKGEKLTLSGVVNKMLDMWNRVGR
jgi:hypothetical protein